MSERHALPEALSIDSGVVLAYLLGEESGQIARDEILSREKGVYVSRVAVSELFYVLCRRRGERYAREVVEVLLAGGRPAVASSDEVDIEAGRYKCGRSVSLADCYVLAVAKVLKAAAVFGKREDDLARELRRKPFDVDVVFLEDLTRRGRGSAEG